MESPSIPADDFLKIAGMLMDHNITVILDGCLAVDALAGKQTRSHEDLDIAVYHQDLPQIRRLLEERGFIEIPCNDSWECKFVYWNQEGHLIDIHSFTFDDQGNNLFGGAYTEEAFSGCGDIMVFLTPVFHQHYSWNTPLVTH